MTNIFFLGLCCMLHWAVENNANPITRKADVAFEFIILHNNDMHANFEQTSVNIGKCSPEDANSNKCYGGFARVAHEVRRFRAEAKNGGTPVIYLNAGDTYTGTPWFAIYKYNITAAFLNKLQPDAISLGNHEFDDNVEGLVPFLKQVEFPVLACNLDLRKVPEITATKNFANSTTLNVNGVRVGVVGYLTPDTKTLAPRNDVEFLPEVESINAEAARLKSKGINIIIALGHSGYRTDVQEIAKKCPDVDIVIGGHSHSFLYTGAQPDVENIEGPYPTLVEQPSGKVVPVVQAYAYTKYLGKLHVKFDNMGNLLEFHGAPILLNASVSRDEDVVQLLEVYRAGITDLENTRIGYTKVFLDGGYISCRTAECNLGNLITDAMVHERILANQGGVFWTDAAIAFIMGGGIRNSIEKRSDGSILEADVLSVLPYGNDIIATDVTGQEILNALELSASLHEKDSNGAFLQMSGIHVTYDYSKNEGQRCTFVEVRCALCNIPVYEPLNVSKIYKVLVPSFLCEGGDGHQFKCTNSQRVQNDKDNLIQYIKQRDFVYPGVEGRITIIETPKTDNAASKTSSFLIMCMCLLVITVTEDLWH